MAQKPAASFFLTLHRKNGDFTGHSVTNEATKIPELLSEKRAKKVSEPPLQAHERFEQVFRAFLMTMESYKKFIPLTVNLAEFLAASMAEKRIGGFARRKGKERKDLSTEDKVVFEVDSGCHREFTIINKEVVSAIEGTQHLPDILLIGLISSYDAFLASLLRVVLNKHDSVFFTSARSITFAELSEFATMDDAKKALIDKEVDGVIRSGHADQFTWMEKHFDLRLRDGLEVWPRFVEICERRNLLTHTGGIVSKQYVMNCKKVNASIKGVQIGGKAFCGCEVFCRLRGSSLRGWCKDLLRALA